MATRNIEDLCRICVQESRSFKNIFNDYVPEGYLYEVINALCHIDISAKDGLPEFICNECHGKVLGFHKFQKTCHDGKAALLSIKMKYNQEMMIDPRAIKTEVFIDEIEYNEYQSCEDSLPSNENQTPGDVSPQEKSDSTGKEERVTKAENDEDRPGHSQDEHSEKTRKASGSNIIPVGIVKCSGDEAILGERQSLENSPRRSFADSRAHENVERGGDHVADRGGCDGGRNVDPHVETALPNNSEEYQIAGVRPDYLPSTALDDTCVPASDRMVENPCERPDGEGSGSFIIKRIYNGSGEGFSGNSQETIGWTLGRNNKEQTRSGYLCPHCGKSINRRFDYESHLRIHSGIKPFECHICHAAFNLKKRLKAHMNVHSSMRLFICAYCQRKFKSKDALRLHIYVHLGEKLPERPSKPYEVWCDICGVRVSESCLAFHLSSHNMHSDLKCDICGEKFQFSAELRAHKLTHTEAKKYQCTKCGKQYGLKGNLSQHMLIHTNDRRFACKTCGKKFYTASRMRRHEQVHSSERNIICSICGRGFKTKVYLQQHLKTHAGGEAPYKCLTCGQRYKWQGDLRKHCRVKNH